MDVLSIYNLEAFIKKNIKNPNVRVSLDLGWDIDFIDVFYKDLHLGIESNVNTLDGFLFFNPKTCYEFKTDNFDTIVDEIQKQMTAFDLEASS